MSHHSDEYDPQIMKYYADAAKKGDNAVLGPTGRFPEGRLTEHDEGEIRFMVFRKDGKVIINFNSPVHWLGMNPNQAIDLGNALLKHARKAKRSHEKNRNKGD